MVETLRVAVAQQQARTLAEAPAALGACRSLVAEATGQGADVVVLPEGAYPAYVLGSAEAGRAALAAGPDPLETFGALAREHRVTLVAGLVLDSPEGLVNAAVTFGPDGGVLGRTSKRFLWHFDARWYVPGHESPLVDTAWGPLGSLVCADVRIPEITRSMAVRGAGLVCDPTAWVTSTPDAPSNIQPEFLVAARCIENGIVMACASKCGFEGPTVTYTGRSMVVGPDGEVLAEASTDREEVVWADVSLDGLPRPPVERTPERYADLGRAWTPLAATRDHVRVAASNHAPVSPAVRASIESEGVELVVTPGLPADEMWVPHESPVARVVWMSRADTVAPEPARIAALRGAEIVAVVEGGTPLSVLRARAAENRVFVVAAGDPACIVAPGGAVIADAPLSAEREFVCSADCLLLEATVKEMAPDTDVFRARQPETYTDLFT